MQMDDVKRAAEDAVRAGGDIRDQIRSLVERATQSAGDAAGGAAGDAKDRFSSILSATIEGAAGAIDRAAPDDASSALRQVIDGLGDGIQRAAQATKLSVQEAEASGKAYASEELKGVATDFATLGEMFVETVERGARGALGQASDQTNALREHAQRTLSGIMPSLEDAARAALSNPAGLAGDSAGAAGNMAREAAGSILSSVSKIIGNAADQVSPKDKSAGGDNPADDSRG